MRLKIDHATDASMACSNLLHPSLSPRDYCRRLFTACFGITFIVAFCAQFGANTQWNWRNVEMTSAREH